MSNSELQLLMDSGLSPDARVLGLYIGTRGPGAQPIPRTDMEDALGPEVGRKRVQKALGQLERRGWVLRTAGGRGRPDVFEFVVPAEPDRSPPGGHLTHREPPEGPLSGPQPNYRGAPEAQLKDREPPGGQLSALRGTPGGQLKEPTHVRATRGRVGDGVGDGDNRSPSLVSPAGQLHPDAERLLAEAADELRGCRGALRDYVVARHQDPSRQAAYIQGVRSILAGPASTWHDATGTAVPVEERIPLLATLLNELMTGETAMAGKLGDLRNLRTKLSVNLRMRGRNGRSSNEAQPRGAATARGGRSPQRRAPAGGGGSKAGPRGGAGAGGG